MERCGPFLFAHRKYAIAARRAAMKMPDLRGAEIGVRSSPGLRDHRGPVHGGAFLRERRIVLDCSPAEFPRIFAHEVAHFVWLRLGNSRRRSWEGVLKFEQGSGDLGWSAEWRKAELLGGDRADRTRKWREYCCEAFCDTAAWTWSGVCRHPEYTLGERWCKLRRRWFALNIEDRILSI